MKKLFITLVLLSSFIKAQTNTLLNADFWKSNPTITVVKEEISKGNNPSQPNGGNFDPTTLAINNNASLEVIKYLVEQPGNSVSKSTHDGRQYIHWAAMRGNLEAINYLIAKGSDVNKTDDKGATPLAFAAGFGQTNPAIYKAFFDAGVNPKEKYSNGETILFKAIGNDKDFKLTEYLLSKGLSLKDVDNNGATLFDYAAINGNVELLKSLIKKGVKPTNSALIYASKGTRFAANTLDTYKYLVEEVKLDPKTKGTNGENVLHNIVRKKDQADIINYFIGKGADVNATDNDGNNSLMIASSTNNLDAVKQILAKTKNINAVNAKGESALFAAVQKGSPEVVSYLIQNGAKTDLKANEGNLGVYLIQSYRKQNAKDFEQKLAIITKSGLNLSTPQTDGSTLYMTAVTKNDLDLLKLLATLKIDVNAQNADGMTALHRAAFVAQDDAVLKYLLSIGAKKDIKTEFDETAYDLASENEYLKENNISVDFLK
ncbi:ankyrin repeat domain-containing protein [Chishuiella sp.]|uniref:ankyrin repeat domain-containing protein n=1 Tax=Chishuiella sp. TaxID=1969467 RepID=UPI0028AABED2|nr:ankyrin repeat domain-containing protein [Chishuiella sp.]